MKTIANYITITEQRAAFDSAPTRNHIRLETELPIWGKVDNDADVVWMNKIGGLVTFTQRRPASVEQKSRGENEYLAAFEDIRSAETALGGKLEAHAGNVPFVLHRMGYFKSYGVRDLTLCYSNGATKIISYDPEDGTLLSEVNGAKGIDSSSALASRFSEIIWETPSAVFFLHRPGQEVNFDLTKDLFRSYSCQPVMSQLESVSIPPGQERNVELLAGLELIRNLDLLTFFGGGDGGDMEFQASGENLVRRMFSYVHEQDQHEYWVFANGNFIGFNNRRAMPGYLAAVDEMDPIAKILVHRSGEKLDFGLENELRPVDVVDGWVDRPERP